MMDGHLKLAGERNLNDKKYDSEIYSLNMKN